MPLTEEEKESLKLECFNAKFRCRETWQVLQQLEKFAKSYWRTYDLWRKRFENADRKLAEEERLQIFKLKKEKKKRSFANTLGKGELEMLLEEIEGRGGEEDGEY